MKIPSIIWLITITFLLFSPTISAADSENERYQALPAGPGGVILIIDTREGHLWTWNNNGLEESNSAGINPRIRYQGNVRKNMTPPRAGASQILQNSKDETRF